MAAPKRTKLEIKKDRVRITEMYIQGLYQHEIAKTLGLSRQQIGYDLKAIQKEWRECTTINLNEYKGKELAKLDRLERTYWQAWERSLEEYRSKTMKAGSDQGGNPVPVSQTIKTENTCGDPRFLQGIERCIAKRCEILGLYAPVKHAIIEPIVVTLKLPEDLKEENI